MDTRTGEIGDYDQMSKRIPGAFLKMVDPEHLSPGIRARLASTGKAHIGRNSPCPCGSQKRFKHCCMTPVRTKKLPKFKKGDEHGKPWRKVGIENRGIKISE